MKRMYLGEFEEVVLLTLALLQEGAYGVTVTQEIERQTGRAVDFSTVHTTLKRLEEKGYLTSTLGGSTAERGGRTKRFFTIIRPGYKALHETQQIRCRLWSQIPGKFHLEGI